MYNRLIKLSIFLCCCLLFSCGSLPDVIPLNSPKEFEKTMKNNEYGILCGQFDPYFIGENKIYVTYNLFLTLQRVSPDTNTKKNEEKQISVRLASFNTKTFSVPLPPGKYIPLSWQCNVNDSHTLMSFTWLDLTPKSKVQSISKGKVTIKDPFPQIEIPIQPGEFTYIGKIKALFPLYDTPIESFAEALKKELEANPGERDSALRYGLEYEAELPPGLTASNKIGFFMYTYASDSFDEYENDSIRTFGESPVFQKIALDNKAFIKAIIRGIGFTYKDLRNDDLKATANKPG
jgi:hypothetical protein